VARRWVFASMYAREETRESRGMAHLFLNTERGFGRQNNPRSLDLRGFSRHLGPKNAWKDVCAALYLGVLIDRFGPEQAPTKP
jgi:hypothetical protein